ncbi:MAG: restriction endonuclease subunit S [Acetobacter sp.]|nr:restriction endonuclease subunit S [Acetobacter sp.]
MSAKNTLHALLDKTTWREEVNKTGWHIEPFHKVASYKIGRTPKRDKVDYWEKYTNAVPWVAISDMKPYGIITKTSKHISPLALSEVFNGHIVPAGTLLMSFKLTIGRIATLAVPACHNEAIISIYPRSDIDQRYLGYFLSQVDYSQLSDNKIKGNTLNKSKIDHIPIPLPPRKTAEISHFS